jgi:two-component system nitrogen regulation sensor histidine kinase NtrY
MVQEFSDFARMPKPIMSQFDMSALIEDVCFARRVVSPDIDIDIKGSETPINLLGDERLLGQAFTNVLKNAAEALEGRPEDVEARGFIEVSMTRRGDHVEIIFKDNGPGFPADVRERLLEPYVSAREGGSGLGLAIVNRVIMDHGGTVQLNDAPEGEVGASVKILLPAIQQEATSSVSQMEYAK